MMFQNNQAFNQQQLPVPFNGIDPSTQNPNLPNGNDRVPPIQLSQWMQQNQQMGLFAIGLFRSMAQSAINKSGTHVAAYNLLAQGQFNNQLWQQYCQMLVEFVEFLVVVRQYNPQQAVETGAQKIYEALLGMVYATYGNQLQQATPNNFWAGLQTAAQMYNVIQQDLQNYRNGRATPNNNFQNGSQLPQINFQQQQQYNQPQQHQLNNFQTSGHTPSYAQPQSSYSSQSSGTAGSPGGSFYDEPAPEKPLRPVEEISSDTTGGYYNNSYQQEQPQMQATFQQPVVEETSLPVPMSVKDVVMDPTYYVPSTFKMDINRPFDVIYSPGGIESRPAQLVDWELTIGDDMPWPQLADPSRFCLFYVKFPDGTVKEKFVEWTPTMQYLRHERDLEMRRKAYRPSGEVVASATPISTIGGDAIKDTEAFDLIKDGHLKRATVPPIILSGVFDGSNDLETEMTVREELQNLMEIEFSTEVPAPACEYRTTVMHPLSISSECFEKLELIRKQESLGQVALMLRELVTQDILPVRYYRFINDRLTKNTNDVLKDGLALTVDITDFCEDYLELETYLTKKKGDQMVTVLRGACEHILKKSMTLMTTEDTSVEDATVVYQIVDNALNFQMGYTLEDLATLNIRKGQATLISASSHLPMLEILKGMIARSLAFEDWDVGSLRLITADGYYLDVIKGRLVAKATLLKLVK